MSTNPLDHVPVTLESHPASMPLALGIGGFVFVACVIGGQLTWRNMRRLLRRSFFQHTSCIGEPTLVGISAGLLFGISIGLGIFYGIEPQLLYHVEAVSAIATVLALLTCGACCFGWLCVLNLDCGLDGTRSWEVVVLCLVPCCCSMTGAIGVGAALGYGLKSRVNYKANAAIQFTQQSIAIGAVVAILLALCLGFCLFNMTRLRRQHRNLYQRRDVLRAIPQDPEQAHAMWFREARMALVMGLHPKVGEKSVLYKQLMHGDIAEPKILGNVFELLGYDHVNLDNNCYPVDEAALQSQRHPLYTRPVTLIRQAAEVAGLPVPPSLANIGLGHDENHANEADYEMQSLAVDNDRNDRDGLHYRGSSATTFAPSAGISGPMMASLHGVSGVAGPGFGGNAPGIAGPSIWGGPTLHHDDHHDYENEHKYQRRDSTDYMFHVRDDDKNDTKRGLPMLAPPPGDHKIDMNTNRSPSSSSQQQPPLAAHSIAITIHDSKETKAADMKRTTIMIPPPRLPSPALPPRISPSPKFRAANAANATVAVAPPLPHISSSLLTTRHHSHSSVIDPTDTDDNNNDDDNDNTLVSSSSSSQILPPLLAPSSVSSSMTNNSDSPTPQSASAGTSITAGSTAAATTPTMERIYTPSSISRHRLHSNSDVHSNTGASPRNDNGNPNSNSYSGHPPHHPHPRAHAHHHHGATSSMDGSQLLRIIPLTVTSSGNDNSPSPETPSSTRAAAATPTASAANRSGGSSTPVSAAGATAASSSTSGARAGSFSGVPLVPIVERNDDERQS